MRALLLVTVAWGFAAAQPSAGNDPAASVKGVVTNSATGAPLRKAYVRLYPASGSARPATTDEHGRFAFEKVTPGTFKLDAEHVGFLQSSIADETGASMELRLTPGESVDVNVKLTPQASISGRVVDQDGDPWVHAYLDVERSVFKQGKRRMEGSGGTEIDDQGRFRIGQLPPGTYYIVATPDKRWERDNQTSAEGQLQPTWYPGSFDSQGSTPIILSAGQELSGLEVRLRRSATYRIRGTVFGLENLPKAPGTGSRLNRVVWASSGLGSPTQSASLRQDGSFEIQGLPSGDYYLGLLQGQPPVGLGRVQVRVDDRDVEGVLIEVPSARTLKGILRFEDSEKGQILSFQIILTDLDSGYGSRSSFSQGDGGFDFPLVIPGRYRVFVPGIYAGQYYVKLVSYQDQEARNGIISISDGDGPLELVLSKKGARVMIEAKPEATQVVLIPDAEGAQERDIGARKAVRDQNGIFNIGNIAPGTYRLFAFESVPDGAWVDTEFWKEIRSKGAELRIDEAESKSAEAPLVTKSEIGGLVSRLGME